MKLNFLFALFLFLITTFYSTPILIQFHPQLVVWNVGQGQWVTYIDSKTCYHLDAGGEFAPWKSISLSCADKKNWVYLTHWDLDHVRFLPKLQKKLGETCLKIFPPPPISTTKQKIFQSLPLCSNNLDKSKVTLLATSPVGLAKKNPNNGNIYLVDGFALVTGDADKQFEGYLSNRLSGLKIKVLIVGHHGSATSTSTRLLNALPKVSQAIASSRYQRYRHPNVQVIHRLKKNKTPLLTTERFGSIWISKAKIFF